MNQKAKKPAKSLVGLFFHSDPSLKDSTFCEGEIEAHLGDGLHLVRVSKWNKAQPFCLRLVRIDEMTSWFFYDEKDSRDVGLAKLQ